MGRTRYIFMHIAVIVAFFLTVLSCKFFLAVKEINKQESEESKSLIDNTQKKENKLVGVVLSFSDKKVQYIRTENSYTQEVSKTSVADDYGGISYDSSNEEVARVDNSGAVTFVKVGEVTITATKAETIDKYKASSAAYELTIENSFPVKDFSAGEKHSLAIKNDGTLHAWGENDGEQIGSRSFGV